MKIKDIQELKDLIADRFTDLDLSEITEDSKFNDDLKIDSLDMLEIVMEVEQQYDIIIDDDDCDNSQTVRDLFHLIQRLTENH